ncbi:hypothetical protein PQX77_019758 [Marasmius sp. AFHP31]|nr:hypothetical protein PQX77_019758 [Marasmius sp. AFHP31]
MPPVTPPPPPRPRKSNKRTATDTATFTSSSNPLPTSASTDLPESAPLSNYPDRDILHQNLRLMTRDFLFVRELENATKTGDIGRIIDISPELMAVFRGAGSAKYAMELLYFLNNLKQIWPEEFNMDMKIEHLINEIKVSIEPFYALKSAYHASQKLYAAKGIYASWDCLGDYAAAIKSLIAIKKAMRTMRETAYHKKEHSNVDTSTLVWRVVNAIEDSELLDFIPDQKVDVEVKSTPDLVAEGWDKWEGCPCKIITASKPCSNLVHAVDPADQHHWHLNPKTSDWRTCDLQPCPHADPLNSIAQARRFPDGSTLVPLPFPSPTPAPELETDLTAFAALLFAAPPTPVGSGPATP